MDLEPESGDGKMLRLHGGLLDLADKNTGHSVKCVFYSVRYIQKMHLE